MSFGGASIPWGDIRVYGLRISRILPVPFPSPSHGIFHCFVQELKPLVAEFVAMTLFVWVGCGTAVSSQALTAFSPGTTNDNSFLTAVALAFGFGIVVLAYSIAPLSGGHINPAVTTSLFCIGEIGAVKAAAYIAVQCLGAILGAALVWGSTASDTLKTATGDQPPFLLGTNVVAEDLSLASAFLAEAMGTFLLVWTVVLTAVSKKSIAANLAPLAIGLSVTLAHLVLIPLTGCGINPARSLGPMVVVIFAGDKVGYEGWWIYYTAPFVGGAVAALVTQFLFLKDEETSDDVEETEEHEYEANQDAASHEPDE